VGKKYNVLMTEFMPDSHIENDMKMEEKRPKNYPYYRNMKTLQPEKCNVNNIIAGFVGISSLFLFSLFPHLYSTYFWGWWLLQYPNQR
jgi:hypothetical protein